MTKYRAKPVIVTADGTMFEIKDIKDHNLQVEGIRFDSKMEAEYYKVLQEAKQMKVIKDFSLQPVFILQQDPKITYKADFEVLQRNGTKQIVDIKGMETAVFRMKKRMFENQFPDLELQVITKKSGQWKTLQEIKKEKREMKAAARKLLKRVKS